MNETAHLSRLAHTETRAVIIDCGTKWVSAQGAVAARMAGWEARNRAWPSYLDFDTGAVLHQSLLTRGYRFASVPDELWSQLRHLHGVTQTAVAGRFRKVVGHLGIAVTETDRSERSVLAEVRDRLSTEYGL